MSKKDTKGITIKKSDDFSEWFQQVILKSELADYTEVSGCIVFRPLSYAIWEKIVKEVDRRFKDLGIQNVYFPLFIPEKTFGKLMKHTEDFAPEVAWVTHSGSSKLNERLAIRPTSETIMYESYSKWIRSYRDLPLKYNQWNNVVRWEFKNPVPFLRTREFLWNEGHTVYASAKDAMAEEKEIIRIYKEVCEEFMALYGITGKKSKKETFPGAEYTISIEYYMPHGKAIQGPDFHYDGQHYAKAYEIKFKNAKEEFEYAYQNTFAISTRMLGVMFAVHSDDKGLVLPPKVAPNKIVIVPIMFEKDKNVLENARKLFNDLKEFNPILDDREGYSPGFKFNEWELKGIPIRLEIGPKDLKERSVILSRRDNDKKEKVKIKGLSKVILKMLEDIQSNLFKKSKKLFNDNIIQVKTISELLKGIENKKVCLTPLTSDFKVEEELKEKTGGAKVLNIPTKQPKELGKCVISGKKAEYLAYVGKSY